MKILFSGGGTGGHFYPIIAIAESLYEKTKEKKIIQPKLYFMSPTRYNPRALFDNDIEFVQVPAGKIRRYFSILNVTDLFKTIYGVISAILKMFQIYPDVVFGKGSYASFPALFAARILKIPVVIHESDSKPGRVNAWAGKFAKKIAISYPESAQYFYSKKETEIGTSPRVAFTGLPIRRDVREPLSNGAREFLNLEEVTPTLLILGGSQGSQTINNILLSALPELLERYQVIHQIGKNNFELVQQTVSVVLKGNVNAYRYHPFDYLNDLALRMSAGVASIIISRAGSAIFEIASWGVPSIIIPLPEEVSHDQTGNAFSYARAGGCVVIQEHNLSPHILVAEIDNLMNNQPNRDKMINSARQFSHPEASIKIAEVLLEIGLEHES
jgi:UDP-N-acetylglucosamine--N-acetylmuramyl-(pentapeptide) pyrophosphoryl-undecaprenol N-acetylglucosamine transferase